VKNIYLIAILSTLFVHCVEQTVLKKKKHIKVYQKFN